MSHFRMDTADRAQLILSYFLSAILLIAGIFALVEEQWFSAFLAGLAFVLSYIPALIAKSFKVYLPIEFEFIFVLFLFGTLYLGEINAYYSIFWWWDLMLHMFSGVMLGLVGFILVYILNYEPRPHLRLSPFFVAIFSFSFSLTIGVLWEMVEFIADQFFGKMMQDPPLVIDTMSDFFVDALGALFVAVLGYFYLKRVKVPLFDRFIKKLIEMNPMIFRLRSRHAFRLRGRQVFGKIRKRILEKRFRIST